MPISAPTRAGDSPVCADPLYLPLVDAADNTAGRDGGAKARQAFIDACCSHCDIRTRCLQYAIDNNEHGPWAGTSDYQRTVLRGHPMSYTHNTAGIHSRAAS